MKRLLLLLLLSCTPSSTDKRYHPATLDSGTCSALCSNAASLGCAFGKDPNCVTACGQAQSVEKFDLACGTNAKTVDAFNKCGGLRCQ